MSRHGFSLVELAVVLVILGLLTGGILGGQALVRAAELRAVGTEYNRFVTAVVAFREKYGMLPGDLNTATSYWTAAGTCPGVSGTAAAGVCNGNGDGFITTDGVTSNELFGAWEHLATAGLLEGSYSGNTGHAATWQNRTPIYGTNVPTTRVANSAGWMFHTQNTYTVADTLYFEGTYDNFLALGTAAPNGLGAVLKPEDAWNIDGKLDDGKPGTGKVRTRESMAGTCTDLAPSATNAASMYSYLLTNSTVACNLMFIDNF